MSGFLRDNKAMQTIRARVAFHSRQHGFDKCMKQILGGTQPRIPASQIANLYAYWGDPLRPSDENYLRSCLTQVNASKGPILQCGAGLMTLLLGAACQRKEENPNQIWCLEHDRHWANLIRSWLTEYQIPNTHVIHSPAKLFKDCSWYSVDTARLAKIYSMVICEGTRATPKGCIGALTRVQNRLSDEFVVLAKQVTQSADLKFLNSWAKNQGASFVIVDKLDGLIKIARGNPEAASLDLPELKTPQRALKTQ